MYINHDFIRIWVFAVGLQFLGLYLSNPILSSSIITSSFVRNQILLLRSFHIEGGYHWVSAKVIIIHFKSSFIVTEEVYALTSEENELVETA